MALQDFLGYKSTVVSSVSADWLMRLVGGQDNTNRQQQQLIPSCHSSRARHGDAQMTHRRRVGSGERSEVTGFKDKGYYGHRGDL